MPIRTGLLVVLVMGISALGAEPRFIGQVSIPADARDLSKEHGEVEPGIPANRWGGQGSGIAWTGRGNRYVMMSDRGPSDGATPFRCRFHIVDIRVDEGTNHPVSVDLVSTHLLTNRLGKPLIGSLSAFPAADDPRGVRFDPEAIRMTSRGTFLISDEYGPSIGEFTAQGRQIDDVPVPSRYQIANPADRPDEELPPHNTSGRQPNRGFEGMALSFDGSTIFALSQGPLIQDGGLDEANKRIGTNIRLLEIKRGTTSAREFLYQLDQPTNGCNEIEMLSPNRFLVIERDSKTGTEAETKLIYEVDLRQATDISKIESLPSTGIPKGVKPAAKKLFINLLDPALNLAGESFPEKIEGLAIGPKLDDGSRLLLVTSDNDFKSDQPSRIYAFAIRLD